MYSWCKNEFKMSYVLTKFSNTPTITTKLGKLECYVIESEAKSNLGSTKLISYFNETYGFLKLDYTNIDSTKIVIEINEV